MRVQSIRTPLLVFVLAVIGLAAEGRAATFGSVVPVRGTVSDIALDESRAAIYVANFTAYRVEIIDIPSRSIRGTISINRPPSAVALSPNKRFLVVGEYEKPSSDPNGGFDGLGGITIRDLNNSSTRHFDLASPVLTVTFGSDGMALILTRTPLAADPENPPPSTNLFLLDPLAGTFSPIDSLTIQSTDLAVPLATFPGQIVQAASAVSGDGKTIAILAATDPDKAASSKKSIDIRYDVATRRATALVSSTSPPAGPRSVALDGTGMNVMSNWALSRYIEGLPYLWAQVPAADPGAFNIGSNAWDTSRNLIYSQIPAPRDGAVLHIFDTDNLTVRERIRLSENLAGRSVMSSDMNTMYSASVSGLTVLPIGQLPSIPQVGAAQEDILFTADACNRLVLTQTLDILSLGNTPSDFTLALPPGLTGVTLSATSGITPARVQITIDPSAFQGARGTTAIPLTVGSKSAVNLPPAVRILVNTRDFDQRGTIVNIPGKLVDMLADPGRGRLYLLRQDKNQVQVWDTATLRQVGILRTGNTPTHMAMTADKRFLMVGSDNSQIIPVYDLNTLQQSAPILMPFGFYPRAIGVANSGMFALSRNAGVELTCKFGNEHLDEEGNVVLTPPAVLNRIDFDNRVATTPCTLGFGSPGVFENWLTVPDGVIAASPDNNTLLAVLADGNVMEYDSDAGTWVASRADAKGLIGPYAAINNELYLAGANLMNRALVQTLTFDDADLVASGQAISGGWGVRTLAAAENGAGTIERWNTGNNEIVSTTAIAESPVTKASMSYTPVGQIGESLLSFTRSLAVSPDQLTIYAATISGLTVLPADFDAVPQPPVVTSVSNTADNTSKIAAGGAMTINGSGLAGFAASAPGYPLPETLGEACATVNNIALPLFRVSPTEIVAQLPFTVTGNAALVIRTPGGIGSPFAINVNTAAPAIFHTAATTDESGLPAVYRDDNGGPLTFTNPIHPNTELTIYLTGLGATSPLPKLGDAAPSDPLANVILTPTVTLGSTDLSVTSASLTPGMATVYQLKVKVPGAVQPGKSVPLTIQSGGISTSLSVRVVSP